jgi:hypothetical protein
MQKDSLDLKYESFANVRDEDDSCNLFRFIIYQVVGRLAMIDHP